MNYIIAIKTALIVFPILAFLFTIPYMLKEYHKFGSIHPYKTGIIYSFILYMLSAYFLIILPLPDIDSVAHLTTARVRLQLFAFVGDFIKDSGLILTNPHTYLAALTKPCFYVPLFNVFLTVPFGIYLHYYFKCSFKKTLLFSFILTMFYEFTQLSGLYFIYPRGYRLFDLDDLLLNTLGGVLGYFIAYLFIKFLPSKEAIEKSSFEKGKKISFIKKLTSFNLDLFICMIVLGIVAFITSSKYSLIIVLIYYIVIPSLLNGATLGNKFLNIKISSNDEKNLNPFRIFLRFILFIMTIIVLPISVIYVTFIVLNNYLANDTRLKVIIVLIVFTVICLYYLVHFIKLVLGKAFMYELISHTKLESTIEQRMEEYEMKKEPKEKLIEHINDIHSTELGIVRIKNNLDIAELDKVLDYCKKIIKESDEVTIEGKNYYVKKDNLILTINKTSYTIITAKKSCK